MNNTNKAPRHSLLEKKEIRRQIIVNIIAIAVTAPVLYFFYYLIAASVTTKAGVTFGNWDFLFHDVTVNGNVLPCVWPVLWETVKFALELTVIDVLVAVPTGYAFSRLSFPGRKFMLKAMFFLSAFPTTTIIIGVFFLLVRMGLINTIAGVLLAKAATMIPGQVYILKGFFDDVPWDYEWASMVDGCSRFQSFRQVILPSAADGIGITAINAFLSGYGEWFMFKILIFDPKLQTMARVLSSLVESDKIVNEGLYAAFAVFYVIPIAIYYMFSQKQLLKINNVGGKKLV